MTIAQLVVLRESGLFNVTELARRAGIEPQTLLARMRRGGPELSVSESKRIDRLFMEAFRQIGTDIQFGKMREGDTVIRCGSVGPEDIVRRQPNRRLVNTIDYPFEIVERSGGYLKDTVSNSVVRVAFSKTAFSMLRNRGVEEQNIVKMGYVEALNELLADLIKGSFHPGGIREIVVGSDEVEGIQKYDPDKIQVTKEHEVNLDELRRAFSRDRGKTRIGFEIAGEE